MVNTTVSLLRGPREGPPPRPATGPPPATCHRDLTTSWRGGRCRTVRAIPALASVLAAGIAVGGCATATAAARAASAGGASAGGASASSISSRRRGAPRTALLYPRRGPVPAEHVKVPFPHNAATSAFTVHRTAFT